VMPADQKPTPKKVRVPKVAHLVAADIRQQIADGVLRAGDSLPAEKDLIEQYGVSRPTLREAIRILETESLISLSRGSRTGAQIRLPDPQVVISQAGLLLQLQHATHSDLYQVRCLIEPFAARLLAERSDPDEVAELSALAEEAAAAAADPARYVRLVERFHWRLVQLTGNQTLNLIGSILSTLSFSTYENNIGKRPRDVVADRIDEAIKSRSRLVRLLATGKAAEAEEHWAKFMRHALIDPLYADDDDVVVSSRSNDESFIASPRGSTPASTASLRQLRSGITLRR
jgi:GntR family transcriptional regulator, transcriptional repressor for pyruvate dehydrogenase complex